MKDFVTALKDLMRRCDEMRALAYRNDGGVSNVFSDRENEKTIDICIGFGKAVAGCSVKDIAACEDLIEEARVKVLETNSALNSLMTKNPSTMAFVNIAENWLLEHLVTDPKSILRIAKYLKYTEPIVRYGLRFLFSDIRQQTEITAPSPRKRFNRQREDFMRGQAEDFDAYLVEHPVTPSRTRLMRAHACWRLHQEAWDKAAEQGIGYSDYKALGRSPRKRCRKV